MQKINVSGYDLVSFKQLSQGKQKMRSAIRQPHASETDRQLYATLIYCNQCQHTLLIFLINYISSMLNIYAHLLSLLFIIGKAEENSRVRRGCFTKRISRMFFPEKREVQVFNSPLPSTHSCKTQSLQKEELLLNSTFKSYLRAAKCCRAATCLRFEMDFNAKLLYFYCKTVLVSAEVDEQITFFCTVLGRC